MSGKNFSTSSKVNKTHRPLRFKIIRMLYEFTNKIASVPDFLSKHTVLTHYIHTTVIVVHNHIYA